MSPERGTIHHTADVFFNGSGSKIIHPNSEAHLLRSVNLLKAGIGSQSIFKHEGSARRNMGFDELLELLS